VDEDAGAIALKIENPVHDSLPARSKRVVPGDEPIWAALEEVTDPEFPVSVLDMGLIYGLRRQGGTAHVDLTFTAMGCPCMEFIIEDIRARLLQEPEITEVEIRVVWDPPWTKERLTARAIERLQRFGVTV
jgi:metal-sulfur cluster biosynthetic enzyme